MEENKIIRAPQYYLIVRKGTALTSCGMPSCITCDQIIPGRYPWYIYVHPKKTKRVKIKETERKKKTNE